MSDYDPYDKSGSGGKPGKPAISWKKADVGDEFTGIVIPPDVDLPEKGYTTSPEWDADDDGNRFRMVWAPRGFMRDGKPWRGPVREHEHTAFVTGNTDLSDEDKKARAVLRPDIMFETEYRKFEYVSAPAKQRITEDGGTDDGVRRVIIGSLAIRVAHEDALKAIGADRPQPGQRWTIRLSDQEPTSKGGHKNSFEVKIEAPTPETMEIVRASVARRKAEAAAGDDPYTKAATGQTEEPPF